MAPHPSCCSGMKLARAQSGRVKQNWTESADESAQNKIATLSVSPKLLTSEVLEPHAKTVCVLLHGAFPSPCFVNRMIPRSQHLALQSACLSHAYTSIGHRQGASLVAKRRQNTLLETVWGQSGSNKSNLASATKREKERAP